MADLCILDLSEARAALRADTESSLQTRSITSEATMNALGGVPGYGGFAAAKLGRLTADWPTSLRTLDQDLQADLRRMRARARWQSLNSPLAARFLQLCRNNIVGAQGVHLTFRIPQQPEPSTRDPLAASVDAVANSKMARAWHKWGKRGSCTVCGRFSFKELQRLVIENTARDGEQFVRLVPVPRTVNPFGFQLQLIDADQVDETYSVDRINNGNRVHMGVEVDAQNRPIAYYVYDRNPFDTVGGGGRTRIPAENMLHFYRNHRTGQTRGYPWLSPSMSSINMLEGYTYAELVAARISSMVVMSIESDPNAPTTDFQGDGIAADGGAAVDIGVGKAITLPSGMHLNDHTPSHPANAFSSFVQQSGRNIASGLGVAYHKLCNDLSGVNYSSGRLGELDERDFWKECQESFIEDFLQPIFENWLRYAALSGALPIPVPDRASLAEDYIHWQPRRWGWVDPLKDAQASTLLVQNGFSTQSGILASEGVDFEDLCYQRKAEQDLADALGLKFGTDIRGMGTSEVNAGPDTSEDEETSSGKPIDPAPATTATKPKSTPMSKPAIAQKGGSAPPGKVSPQ